MQVRHKDLIIKDVDNCYLLSLFKNLCLYILNLNVKKNIHYR